MKKALGQQQGRAKALRAAAVVMFLGLADASAQLAITECMSWAATTQFGTNAAEQQSDWWELTNYGTNAVDLTGYSWTDSDDGHWQYDFSKRLVISPGESVVFFRTQDVMTENEEEFRSWWGGGLSDNVRVIGFLNPGFDNVLGDEIRLYDDQTNLVDEVSFGPARIGKTFVSNTKTGDFGFYSTLGESNTFKAATADDIGSPGTASPKVSLSILEQPTNLTASAGSDQDFRIRACGLPRPKYEWQFFNTNSSFWESIPGGNSSSLTIMDVQPADEGEYRVVVTNGLERLVSQPFRLTVDTNLSPPLLQTDVSNVGSLCELYRFAGETARFINVVWAFPRASFQWYSNGVPIVGAENRDLEVPKVTLAMSGTVYSVISSNELGWIQASSQLFVQPFPTLEITEAMPAPSNNGAWAFRANWWELTNRGTNGVALHGFCHSDGPFLSDARVVTHNVVLQPGESLIMVEGLTRDQFIRWWGETNLPPGLQVITYGSYGLNRWYGSIYLWSAAGSLLADVGYASPTPPPKEPPTCPDICDPEMEEHPLYGHSLFFDQNQDWRLNGRPSQENQNGAFRAAESDDVGSPGFAWHPQFLSISRNGIQVTLKCRVIRGKTYELECNKSVGNANWTMLSTHAATSSTLIVIVTPEVTLGQRFYRLRELP